MITSRHSLKFTGQILLAILVFCLFSSLPLSSFAGESPTDEFNCNAEITNTSNSITISGLNAPNVILKVFNPNWSVNFECSSNCGNAKTVNNLSEGTYHISVRFYDSNWSLTCEQAQDVTVSGDTTPPPPSSDCDVTYTTTNNSITIRGLNTPHVIFKLFNPNWSINTQCFDNCSNPLTISGLTSGATYHLSYNLYDANWQQICEDTKDVVIGGGSGGQPDLDLADLNVPAQGVQGTVANYTFDLKNIGQVPASGDYTIGAYLSTNNSLGNSDVRVGEVNTGNTPVGTIQDVQGAITIPANQTAGNYFLILKADIDNVIAESNENNNKIARPIEVVGEPSGGACGFFKEDAISYDPGTDVFNFNAAETSSSYVLDFSSSTAPPSTRTVRWTIDKNGNNQGLTDTTTPVQNENTDILSSELLDNGSTRITLTDRQTGSEIWTVNTTLNAGSGLENIAFAALNNMTVYDGYLVVGTLVTRETATGDNRFFQFSIKIDEAGTLRNRRILGEDAFGTTDFVFSLGALYTTQNGYVFSYRRSNNLSLIKFSESGRFLWVTSFASDLPSNRLRDVKVTANQRFIYTLNINNQRSFIDKINANTGEKVYKLSPPAVLGFEGFSQFADEILLTPDGGVVVGVTSRFPNSDTTTPEFVYGKLDANGNKVWGNALPLDELIAFTPVLQTSDGGFLFVRNDQDNRMLSVFKVTADGNLTPACDDDNGTGTELPCDLSYTVNGNNLSVSGSGLAAGHVIIKIFNPNWQTIYSCLDDCGSSINLSNLTPGTYHINIALFSNSWQKTCDALEDIPVNVSTSAIVADNSLLYFDAVRNGTAANLNWVVNNSNQTDYFLLERSATGDEFEVIGEMNEVDNSSQALNYQLKDTAPVNGNNFYRVQQVFADGSIRYSNMQHLMFNNQAEKMLVYPNPAAGEVFLSLQTEISAPEALVIFNQLGQAVQQIKLSEVPATPIRLEVDGLKDGMYQVVLYMKGGKILSQKLVLAKL